MGETWSQPGTSTTNAELVQLQKQAFDSVSPTERHAIAANFRRSTSPAQLARILRIEEFDTKTQTLLARMVSRLASSDVRTFGLAACCLLTGRLPMATETLFRSLSDHLGSEHFISLVNMNLFVEVCASALDWDLDGSIKPVGALKIISARSAVVRTTQFEKLLEECPYIMTGLSLIWQSIFIPINTPANTQTVALSPPLQEFLPRKSSIALALCTGLISSLEVLYNTETDGHSMKLLQGSTRDWNSGVYILICGKPHVFVIKIDVSNVLVELEPKFSVVRDAIVSLSYLDGIQANGLHIDPELRRGCFKNTDETIELDTTSIMVLGFT